MAHAYRLGIDIGGTFTDMILMDEASGQLRMLKTPSVPASPADAVLHGIQELVERDGLVPSELAYFSHGTTLAVNTVIQRNGAVTGLLVTAGFRDILELQRLRLPNPHSFDADRPKPLVRRRHVWEIHERVTASGTVLVPLDPAEVERATAALVTAGVTAVAICFLHAYRYDEHERRAKAIVRAAFPELYVCTSAEVWPQQREYERALITVMNAYVGDRMRRYFATLRTNLERLGVHCPILSTKSNGGIMSAASAGDRPVQTLLSGPAAGVIGALAIGRVMGRDRIVTLDMGGTSADIAIVDGAVPYATDSKVGEFPLIMPALDVASIGAGGGSIAWTGAGGVLKVGPQSAGADPGPACYGRGGEAPTVTDAYVAVGIVDPAQFLGGTMPLDARRAHVALNTVGRVLGQSPQEAASSILQVATSNMYAEFLPAMARRGVDPRDFAIVAYGGAGPTHAFLLAREVGMRTVIIPPNPGTLCALGSLMADVRGDFVRTVYASSDELSDGELARVIEELRAEARTWLADQRTAVTETLLFGTAEMRYTGQSYEIAVAMPEMPQVARLVNAFHERYRAIYGYSDEAAAVELIDVRATIVGVVPKPSLAYLESPGIPLGSARRAVYHDRQMIEAIVHPRAALHPDTHLVGPVIVEQYDTTTFIPPGFAVAVDAFGNLIGEVV